MDIIRGIFEPVARVLFALPKAISMASHESFFPEKERKSFVPRLIDNIMWCLRFKEANSFYYLYGFDVKGKDQGVCMDYLSFAKQRDRTNRKKSPDAQIALLRDKYLFFKYLKAFNIPTPEVFGLIKNGVTYNSNLEIIV